MVRHFVHMFFGLTLNGRVHRWNNAITLLNFDTRLQSYYQQRPSGFFLTETDDICTTMYTLKAKQKALIATDCVTKILLCFRKRNRKRIKKAG
jgi:hypothetical protein